MKAEYEDQKQQNKERSTVINTKSGELIQAIDQIQSLKVKNEDLLQQIENYSDSVIAKEKELIAMQQTLRINSKLVLKSDIDLRDLQSQYRTAIQLQHEQHNLLCELKEKLRQASVFYQKLNLESPVLDGDMLEQSDTESNKVSNRLIAIVKTLE